MTSWDRSLSLADPAAGLLARFQVIGPRRVERIQVDLLGDGQPGWQLTFEDPEDGRTLRGWAVRPWRAGAFNLTISAVDEANCSGATGLQRPVLVTP